MRVLRVVTTQDTHTAGEGMKLEGAKQEILFLQARGSNFSPRRLLGMEAFVCCQKRLVARLPGIRCGGSFYAESASKLARFFTVVGLLAMQGTLPQVLLMLDGQ